MKSYLAKFKSYQRKIVQTGPLQKLQNSIQTLTIFWPVYPIHTNSLFWVIFVALPFRHFPPPNTSFRGKDSKIQLTFHLNILVFQTNEKQPYSFPVLSRFCNGLHVFRSLTVIQSGFHLSVENDLHQFFIESEVKPKPIVTHSDLFSCTLRHLHVITSSFDWFTGLSMPLSL